MSPHSLVRLAACSPLALALVTALAGCAADALPDDPLPGDVDLVDPLDQVIADDEGLPGAHLGDGDVALAGSEAFGVPTAAACAVTINPGRELVIRSLAVVNDPVRTKWTGATTNPSDGAWSFGRLMTQMAGTQDPAVFVRNWLRAWEADRTINGLIAPRRTAISSVIAAWPKRADGALDLKRSPMRLLAIMNRFDLRGTTDAGEGRFVFGVLDAAGSPLPFTIILEYKLPAATLAAVHAWATEWHALAALAPSTVEYRAALERLTNRFTRKGASPSRPNGSAIGQIRTNEIALAAPWQLREFRLNTAGALAETTVARSPANSLNGTARLARWVNANQSAILGGVHGVPLTFEALPFRGAVSNNDLGAWRAPGIASGQARHLFAVNTCDGCHGAETGTSFLHVGTRTAGALAPLSGFMTGITVTDPVSGVSRTFADLTRRAVILKNFLCAPVAVAEGAPDSLRTD